MERTRFPTRASIAFLLLTLLLRAAWVAATNAFPVLNGPQRTARILIGLGGLIVIIWLNERFLRKGGFDKAALRVGIKDSQWFLAGCLLIVPFMILMASILRLLTPFHWVLGELTWQDLGWSFAEYFTGNAFEELMFHGYLLVALCRSMGFTPSLLILGVFFGLFHLPGLSGIAAIKMICSTASWSIVFGLAYIRTGSLWTAIGMHVFGNTLLHSVMGMSVEPSLFRVVLNGGSPTFYDPGFLALVAATMPAVFLLIPRRHSTPELPPVTHLPKPKRNLDDVR